MKLNKSIRILLITSAIMTFVMGIFSPFYSIFVIRIGGSVETAGLSWAIFLIVSGVMTLSLLKWEMSVRNHKLLYGIGHIIRSAAFLIYLFTFSITHLIIAQVLLGISMALGNPSFDALYSKHSEKDHEISDWGGWEGWTMISAGLAAILGGYVIQNFGFVYIFCGMTIVSFVIGVYLLLVPRDLL